MPVSGDDLWRAVEELARRDARLRKEAPCREFEVSRFLPALQDALTAVQIQEGFSTAGRVAWKVLRALRVEGD